MTLWEVYGGRVSREGRNRELGREGRGGEGGGGAATHWRTLRVELTKLKALNALLYLEGVGEGEREREGEGERIVLGVPNSFSPKHTLFFFSSFPLPPPPSHPSPARDFRLCGPHDSMGNLRTNWPDEVMECLVL